MCSDQSPDVSFTISALGQEGILIRFGDGMHAQPQAALSFAALVRSAGIAGVRDIAPALSSVQVRFDPASISRAALCARIETIAEGPILTQKPSRAHRLWTIPASFDGPQLAEAAALAGLSPQAAIADICGQEVSVLAIGFAPGQPYLGMLGENWGMPRQSGLTPQVPAGALVVALRQLVLFANPSPTGWRWIASCAFSPFRTDRAEPFALRPDDRVRFVPTDAQTIATLRAHDPNGMGGARCEGRL